VNFWGAHIEIPAGSKIIVAMANTLMYRTPDNYVFSYTITSQGILTSVIEE
jgi:hypothetical protein